MGEKLTDQTGWYTDQTGEVWHCVDSDGRVVCTSAKHFTVASHATFERWKSWGWKRKDEPAGRAALSSEGK